jgi:hypothetical protein
MGRLSTARAASFTASFSVGWAWQVRARSSAEPAVGGLVGQHLHEPVGGAVDLGAAVGGEGELAHLVVDLRLFELLLGLADRCDFRRGVDH